MFLRHVEAGGEPFAHDFLEGAKGVQLAELGLQSWAERRWLDVPPLDAEPLHGANARLKSRDANRPAAATR